MRHKVRGERRRWLELAQTNAEQTLLSHLASKETIYRRFLSLRDLLGMEEIPQRMECFDISHSHGESTVASCVVFDANGPLKSDYRIYNINGVTAGDDYGAMRQVLTRRYRKLTQGEGKRPDLVFIDGGKGQLNIAREVFEELGITDITLIGVAKGVTRKAGMETLVDALTNAAFRMPPDSVRHCTLSSISATRRTALPSAATASAGTRNAGSPPWKGSRVWARVGAAN